MTAEQNAPRAHESIVHKPLGILHGGPDVHMAAVGGVPQMEAESESDAGGTDVLTGGSHVTLVGGSSAGTSGAGTSSTGTTGTGTSGIVATVKPGEAAPAGNPTSATTSEDVNGTSTPESTSAPVDTGTGAADPAATTNAPADGSASSSADAGKTDGSQTSAATTDNNQKESSSKKKGLKKLLPW
jgi:hypothetical protein